MIEWIEPSREKWGERAGGARPDILLIHSTDLPTQASLEALAHAPREVSAHYLIAPEGKVYGIVPEEKRAWHAGKSFWRGHGDINSTSIGIELVWPADREASEDETPGPFTSFQMDSLIALAADITARWHIPPENILAHSDVAPGRKRDPGPRFDWPLLAQHGLGLWPERPLPAPVAGDIAPALARYGYKVSDPHAAVVAFQRHFRPRDCNGIPDNETRSLLQWLLTRTRR